MHPITFIEITATLIFVILLFTIAFLLPASVKRAGLLTSVSLTVLVLLFFAVRPFWIEYQADRKMKLLEEHLAEKYPDEKWEIQRQEGRQYNPYHFKVTFENENSWIYTYSTGDEENICQSVWTPPEGMVPSQGEHFEGDCGE